MHQTFKKKKKKIFPIQTDFLFSAFRPTTIRCVKDDICPFGRLLNFSRYDHRYLRSYSHSIRDAKNIKIRTINNNSRISYHPVMMKRSYAASLNNLHAADSLCWNLYFGDSNHSLIMGYKPRFIFARKRLIIFFLFILH